MAKLTASHFQFVAEIYYECRLEMTEQAWDRLLEITAGRFQENNEKFNKEQFYEACNFRRGDK